MLLWCDSCNGFSARDFHGGSDGHAPTLAVERGIQIRKQSSEGRSDHHPAEESAEFPISICTEGRNE
jgi:hypothetical protein